MAEGYWDVIDETNHYEYRVYYDHQSAVTDASSGAVITTQITLPSNRLQGTFFTADLDSMAYRALFGFTVGTPKNLRSGRFSCSYNGSTSVTATFTPDWGEYPEDFLIINTRCLTSDSYIRIRGRDNLSVYNDIPQKIDINSSNIGVYPAGEVPVKSMNRCFYGNTNLLSAPAFPDAITDMYGAFYNTGISIAPTVPSAVKDVSYAFNRTKVAGDIVVNNIPTAYTWVFGGTGHDIFIVNGGSASDSVWREIAEQKENTHYEADDNPVPTVAFSVTRVGSQGSREGEETGTYAYIRVETKTYSTVLPSDWTCDLNTSGTVLKKDGTEVYPTWTRSSTTVDNVTTTVSEAWVNLGDVNRHVFTLQEKDVVKDTNNVIKAERSSIEISNLLSAAYATMDFHAGGDGVAVGTFSKYPGFHIDMDTGFSGDLFIELDVAEDADLIQNIEHLGLTDQVILSVTMNRSTMSIRQGSTGTLTATVKPAGRTVTWESSDTSVATVNGNGVVTGVATGTATISAYVIAGGIRVEATCAISVS